VRSLQNLPCVVPRVWMLLEEVVPKMKIILNINNQDYPLNVPVGERLLETLRRLGFFSVKYGGCEKGECGACAVLFDGRPVNSCTMFTAQAEGHKIQTVESLVNTRNRVGNGRRVCILFSKPLSIRARSSAVTVRQPWYW